GDGIHITIDVPDNLSVFLAEYKHQKDCIEVLFFRMFNDFKEVVARCEVPEGADPILAVDERSWDLTKSATAHEIRTGHPACLKFILVERKRRSVGVDDQQASHPSPTTVDCELRFVGTSES